LDRFSGFSGVNKIQFMYIILRSAYASLSI